MVTDLQLPLSGNGQAGCPAVSAHWSLHEAQESAHAMQLISKAIKHHVMMKQQMLFWIRFVVHECAEGF